jgi:hypothetical protein
MLWVLQVFVCWMLILLVCREESYAIWHFAVTVQYLGKAWCLHKDFIIWRRRTNFEKFINSTVKKTRDECNDFDCWCSIFHYSPVVSMFMNNLKINFDQYNWSRWEKELERANQVVTLEFAKWNAHKRLCSGMVCKRMGHSMAMAVFDRGILQNLRIFPAAIFEMKRNRQVAIWHIGMHVWAALREEHTSASKMRQAMKDLIQVGKWIWASLREWLETEENAAGCSRQFLCVVIAFECPLAGHTHHYYVISALVIYAQFDGGAGATWGHGEHTWID